jgi:hypothetical protein
MQIIGNGNIISGNIASGLTLKGGTVGVGVDNLTVSGTSTMNIIKASGAITGASYSGGTITGTTISGSALQVNGAINSMTFGYGAGGDSTNTFIGTQANVDGTASVIRTTGLGLQNAQKMKGGADNVLLGYRSAFFSTGETFFVTTVDNCVFIGSKINPKTGTPNNSIIIGALGQGEGDNTTVIGNSSTVKTHLYGTVQLDSNLTVNGTVSANEFGRIKQKNTNIEKISVVLPRITFNTGTTTNVYLRDYFTTTYNAYNLTVKANGVRSGSDTQCSAREFKVFQTNGGAYYGTVTTSFSADGSSISDSDFTCVIPSFNYLHFKNKSTNTVLLDIVIDGIGTTQ